MKVSESSLVSSTIISATVGTILIAGLVPAAIKASKNPALNSLIKIEQADKNLQGQ